MSTQTFVAYAIPIERIQQIMRERYIYGIGVSWAVITQDG